jgi:hypothetical protein
MRVNITSKERNSPSHVVILWRVGVTVETVVFIVMMVMHRKPIVPISHPLRLETRIVHNLSFHYLDKANNGAWDTTAGTEKLMSSGGAVAAIGDNGVIKEKGKGKVPMDIMAAIKDFTCCCTLVLV